MNATASTYTPEEQFNATLLVDGGYVHVVAKSLAALIKTVGQLRPTETVGKTTPAEVKVEKVKPEPKKEAAAQVEKPAQSVAAPAVSEPAGAASAPASAPSSDEPARPTYDDVKRAVLAMAKISGDKALATLKSFTGQNGEPCDHGTKLKLEDYPAFLAKAQLVLDEVKA